jgi:hypothetical protein
MISSVNPSLKYSWSGSGLIFSKGSTMIDLSWTGELSDFKDDLSGVLSCFFLLTYQGRMKARGSPIAARMYNRLKVLSGIENLFDVISRNSIMA